MYKLSNQERAVTKFYLSLLKTKSPLVHSHVTRVALLATRAAKALGKDIKAAYMGALYHDVGKLCLDSALFNGQNITNSEYATVQSHAKLGADIIKNQFLFTSMIAGLHHNMAVTKGYDLGTKDLPDLSPGTTKKLLDIAALVSIADFIEAYTSRKTAIKDSSLAGKSLPEMLHGLYPNDSQLVTAVLAVEHLL